MICDVEQKLVWEKQTLESNFIWNKLVRFCSEAIMKEGWADGSKQ